MIINVTTALPRNISMPGFHGNDCHSQAIKTHFLREWDLLFPRMWVCARNLKTQHSEHWSRSLEVYCHELSKCIITKSQGVLSGSLKVVSRPYIQQSEYWSCSLKVYCHELSKCIVTKFQGLLSRSLKVYYHEFSTCIVTKSQGALSRSLKVYCHELSKCIAAKSQGLLSRSLKVYCHEHSTCIVTQSQGVLSRCLKVYCHELSKYIVTTSPDVLSRTVKVYLRCKGVTGNTGLRMRTVSEVWREGEFAHVESCARYVNDESWH